MSFQPGAHLCERFYWQCVRPVLEAEFPGLLHAAALLDGGSEVLGLDDAVSTDHGWGPRGMLFVRGEDHARVAPTLHAALAQRLPFEFEGYPTHFTAPDPGDHGTQLLQATAERPIRHRVGVWTARGFVDAHLAFDLDAPLEPADWLTFSEQRLATFTRGPVYHDGVGLAATRARFAYYPRDVWLYLLAAGWARLGQEEHLMGRAGQAGDEVGSALIGARLVRDVMRLWFLMARTYAPYPKWLGTLFRQLPGAEALWPRLLAALRAATWPEREAALAPAYEALAARHNALALTPPMPERPRPFFGRPFLVIALHGFAGALARQIEDPAVRRIAERPLIGGLDQLSDNTDLVAGPAWRARLRGLYE